MTKAKLLQALAIAASSEKAHDRAVIAILYANSKPRHRTGHVHVIICIEFGAQNMRFVSTDDITTPLRHRYVSLCAHNRPFIRRGKNTPAATYTFNSNLLLSDQSSILLLFPHFTNPYSTCLETQALVTVPSTRLATRSTSPTPRSNRRRRRTDSTRARRTPTRL